MYESHVTVTNISEKHFLDKCSHLKVKPVIIKNDTGSNIDQMMTAKFHKVGYDLAIEEMSKIASNFPSVNRRKLEYIVGKNKVVPPHKYLEFHAKFEVPAARLEEFSSIVRRNNGHTATNFLKAGFAFATARSELTFNNILSRLSGYKLINQIRECVVYDDNPQIDNNWECMECPLKAHIHL